MHLRAKLMIHLKSLYRGPVKNSPFYLSQHYPSCIKNPVVIRSVFIVAPIVCWGISLVVLIVSFLVLYSI